MGSLFVRQSLYAELFSQALSPLCPGAKIEISSAPASLGAVRLALHATDLAIASAETFTEPELHDAATEQSNPRSAALDHLTSRELVDLFVREERCVEDALGACADALTRAIDLVAGAMKSGGRLFYSGAGTSGRLGVLDASEMPPTFGVSPSQVQAMIAGGPSAIQQSIEGAEDDPLAGAQAVRDRGVTAADVVCGITASGRTPFVRGALEAAAGLGAGTILVTCNPARAKDTTHALRAQVEIDLPTGPELITGSTRLKAGTATKVTLNIISSCAMIRLGRVDGNFMSCLQPTNNKLRDRAARFVASQLRISEAEARYRLEWAKWNIRDALRAKESAVPFQNPATRP
jgi:N-acetylmuramic acid 6-phosphate etherase